ncbi:hypothetical protein ACHAXR_006812 [Thalassiosira sp. AJA248-18]
MTPELEPEYYSVALVGSSGGGTATLGHTDAIELLTTIHRELLRIRDRKNEQGRRCRVCIGLSHAIFVSLCDGTGFDSIPERDWLPEEDECGDGAGPTAALYAVGFHDQHRANYARDDFFRVTLVDEGPLTKINRLAQTLDVALSKTITSIDGGLKIAAIISLSSEPTIIHSKSLGVCNLPTVGSGGTSLSQIASLHDLRIVGNSGGSVASTTLTKARGWAMGLTKEWNMSYDATNNESAETNEVSKTNPTPTLKSILEAALPSFLFVCIAIHAWGGDSGVDVCLSNEQNGHANHAPMSFIKYALQHIVLGTTCCILAASSYNINNKSGDQSTLLMSATIAGVIASASASQSAFPTPSINGNGSYGGGSALAGLVGGAFIPLVLEKVSSFCFRYHVTATMTNILCGGGVGMLVGMLMHLTGLAHGLGIVTETIRSLLRWKMLLLPERDICFQMPFSTVSRLFPCGLERGVFPIIHYLQEQWSAIMSHSPSFLYEWSLLQAGDRQCSPNLLPVPIGFGFLYGCIFVYGSKVGLYHSLFLPAILLEMDSASKGEEASLLGAIDECTLVMVCAGICAGNLVLPPSSKQNNDTGENVNSGGGHASLSIQALKTNLLCGDFIEACYPSMERSKIINGSAYLAAGLSTEIILQRRVLSTAYLPLPLAIFISNDSWGMSIACLVAFVVAFSGTLAFNVIDTCRR